MKTIWKFPIELAGRQEVMAPTGTKFLSTQLQKGQICLWGEVDTDRIEIPHQIAIVGTGRDDMPADPKRYLGTVQMLPYVWHIYEVL